MRGASSGVAIAPPRTVSKMRRFTDVDDDIAFLHGCRLVARMSAAICGTADRACRCAHAGYACWNPRLSYNRSDRSCSMRECGDGSKVGLEGGTACSIVLVGCFILSR